jgi:hypothetical protein
MHRALAWRHAAVQVLRRQLALQVPDDLITLHRKQSLLIQCASRGMWKTRNARVDVELVEDLARTCVIRGRDLAVWRTAAAAHAMSRAMS